MRILDVGPITNGNYVSNNAESMHATVAGPDPWSILGPSHRICFQTTNGWEFGPCTPQHKTTNTVTKLHNVYLVIIYYIFLHFIVNDLMIKLQSFIDTKSTHDSRSAAVIIMR